MQQVALLSSQNKFNIDNSFRIFFPHSFSHEGNSNKRKHMHMQTDQKRFSKSIVTIAVGDNLCMPAVLVFRKFRLAHNISEEWGHSIRSGQDFATTNAQRSWSKEPERGWRNADGPWEERLLLTTWQLPRKKCFPEIQIKVISADQGHRPIATVPKSKTKDMQEIYLLHEKGHFDLLTFISRFHVAIYWCEVCEKAFDHKEPTMYRNMWSLLPAPRRLPGGRPHLMQWLWLKLQQCRMCCCP